MIKLVEVEIIEEQEGTALVRLKTGFGDPVFRVTSDKIVSKFPKRENSEFCQ